GRTVAQADADAGAEEAALPEPHHESRGHAEVGVEAFVAPRLEVQLQRPEAAPPELEDHAAAGQDGGVPAHVHDVRVAVPAKTDVSDGLDIPEVLADRREALPVRAPRAQLLVGAGRRALHEPA